MTVNSYLNDEEKKKRKPGLLSEIGNMMPGAQRGQETGRMVSDAYDKGGLLSAAGMGLRRAPGDILTGIGDFVDKGIVQPTNRVLAAPINALADIGKTVFTGEVEPTGAKTQLVPTANISNVPRIREQIGQLQSDGSRLVIDQRPLEQSSNIKAPTLKELPNAQRDAELGKMNVSTNENVVTYDIGGNTLSYDASQKDKSIKANSTNLNNSNSNGLQQVGNMDVSFDPSVSSEARARFLENPVAPIAQMARYDAYQNTPRGRYFGNIPVNETSPQDVSIGETFMQGIQTRKDKAASQIANDAEARNINRANLINLQDRNEIERNKLLLDADANRLNELDIRSQNKLRDIQGQVAQQPPVKDNQLKPIVVEEPDPTDPLGERKRQVIKMPNAEGTGYVDNMPNQTTFTTPKPATTAKLLKMRDSKDPNFAAAEAEYKIRFGTLPY